MATVPSLSVESVEPEELAIDHKIEVNALSGAARVTVPLALSPGRSDFGPRLTLEYDSSAGNSIFGVGWSLNGMWTIGVDTGNVLPRYDGSDQFSCSGTGELVRCLHLQDGQWHPRVEDRGDFWVHYFRPRIDISNIRFERWVSKATRRTHWRTRDVRNVLTIFGLAEDDSSRIVDPEDPSRVFAWLPETQFDPYGNAIQFHYLAENTDGIDSGASYERSRIGGASRLAQRLLKRVRYGNTMPLQADAAVPAANDWLFEVVFDFGDHGDSPMPTPEPDRQWRVRPDPYSTYRPGFEVRTYRLCRRVLLFHRFAELGQGATLVGAYQLDHDLRPEGTLLTALRYTGFRRDADPGQTERSIPPLSFTYTAPSLQPAFEFAPEETSINAPNGLTGPNYRWIDLYAEGLPGILTETDQAWYFKPNEGGGRLGDQQVVVDRPAYRLGQCALIDFDGDGNLDLAVLHGRNSGFYEHDRETDSWAAFRPFPALPHLEAAGARAQWLDLNGDGRSELMVSELDRLTWYPSLGKDGFGPPAEIQKPPPGDSEAAPLGEDLSQDLFFADMNGDGLPDQVRVRNGRVEYWPQLGNGRFGHPVLMEGAPVFAPQEEFEATRVVLVDLDGSGTSDIVYVGRGEVRYWINAQGNRLIEGDGVSGLPIIDNLSTVRVLDFLADTTPCLVWSSPLPDRPSPIRYLRLTNGVTPRLLASVDNSMGKEVRFTYSSSSAHYLRDKRAGRPWASTLPANLVVVDLLEANDRIGGSRSVSRYEYHDGYQDGRDRAFRGFGHVDQFDTEGLAGDEAPDTASVAPALLRTWFHLGRPYDRAPAGRYEGDGRQALLTPHSIADLSDLTTAELEDGVRALAGLPIRQEVFALTDSGRPAEHPIDVVQHSFDLRRVQPQVAESRAAFTHFLGETVTYQYEGQGGDPRVSHELVLEFDDFGNVLLDCGIAYARRTGVATEIEAQGRTYGTARHHRYSNVDESDRHELGIPIETQEFELGGLTGDDSALIRREDLRGALGPALAVPLHHHEGFSGTAIQARLVGWDRRFYTDDAGTDALPLGSVGFRSLLHHEESACFTPSFVAEAFGASVDDSLLRDAGYVEAEGHWWQVGDLHQYGSADAFFHLSVVERPDGGRTTFTYDGYALALLAVDDALGNRIRAEIDYHLLRPRKITDPNDNVTEALFDPLGVVVVSTAHGQVLDEAGTIQPFGEDALSAYVVRSGATFPEVVADPNRFLQSTSHYLLYELDRWTAAGEPPRVVRLAREQFTHDGRGGGTSTSRAQVEIAYFDGFRRVLQSKVLAEPGPALLRDAGGRLTLDATGRPVEGPAPERWLVAGHTAYNRKQQPIRQYEPFFSVTPAYEPEEQLASFGAFQRFAYDAVGRQVREDMANGTHTRTEYSPWEVRRFDPNDTVLESLYRLTRDSLPEADPEKQALRKAEAHANTPSIVHVDPRGFEVAQVEIESGGAHRSTRTTVDVRGQPLEYVDQRGLTAFTFRYDLLGRPCVSHSADAGDARTLSDIYDRPIHTWDARGVHQRRRFDLLDRPIDVFVDGALGLSHLTEQMIYGEDPSILQPELRNARGRLALHRDQAGTLAFSIYAPTGEVLRMERRLRQDYRSEPDWSNPGSVTLEAAVHTTANQFDALGRVRRQSLADGSTRRLDYLRGGGLERVTVSTDDGLLTDAVVLDGSSFNARGQRTQVRLGNGVEVGHGFDPETFRTSRITAQRPPTTPGGSPVSLADIEYTYDPVGNVTRYVDRAQEPVAPTPLLQGLNVSSVCDLTYDAFYQLTEATGRVHQALLEHDYRPGLKGSHAMKGTRHLSLNNGAAVERYTRTYQYDAAGNIGRVHHQGTTRSWTTEMWVSPTSNRSVPATDPAGRPITDPDSAFDANGNCSALAHLRRVEWNYRNTIARAVLVDRSGSGDPDDAEYYVYDGAGLRVRKVTERLANGQLETTERIYLDGCDIKRIRTDGQLRLERMTSHVSDGIDRVALIHRWRADSSALETSDLGRPRIRYQLTNHLGSALMELDDRGRVVSYEEFFPFGGTAFIAGDRVREVRMKDYRFCGKERDEGTGLYYFEYRYYAAWIGRWMSPDPIGPQDVTNLYVYAFNNPINFVDPDGLQGQPHRQGKLHHIAVDHIPRPYWKAYLSLSPEQRELFNQNKLVLYRDPRNGLVSPMSPEESAARVQADLRAGYDMNKYERGARTGTRGRGKRGEGAGTGAAGEGAGASAGEGPGGGDQGEEGGGGGGGGEEEVEGPSTRPSGDATGGQDGTGGGARSPDGSSSGGNGASSSGDPAASDTNSGDGRSTPRGSPTAGSGADGRSGKGPGSTGTGRKGRGAGGGGRRLGGGAGMGGGLRGEGTRRGPSGRGPGTDPLLLPWTIPSEDGIPGEVGAPGGIQGGIPGGIPGGLGPLTDARGGADFYDGPAEFSRPPGSASGLSGSPGQTGNGDDSDGSRRGTGSGNAGQGARRDGSQGQGPGAGGSAEAPGVGDASGAAKPGEGGSAAAGGAKDLTWADRHIKYVGWLNLEFGDGDPEGESGGIPGGMGSHNWGTFGQALYTVLSVASIVTIFFGGGGIKAFFRSLASGLKSAAAAIAKLFTRQFWREEFLVGLRAASVRVGRFFYDPRTWDQIRRAYWAEHGPALGRSLHHWLIPRRWARKLASVLPAKWGRRVWGITNAGFNLLEMPRIIRFGRGGLNEWMGFAQRWGGRRAVLAHVIENSIRIAIPGSLVGGAYGGYRIGEGLSRDADPPPNPRNGSGPEVEQHRLVPSPP